MNWKLVIVGGLLFYICTFIVSFATGPLIHNGVLKADYEATEDFWRPELRTDPPDMAALMPMWITNGIISSLIFALIYGCIRPSLTGPGWMKGVKFGLIGATFSAMFCLGWYGVFDLPGHLWIWWAGEGYVYWLIGGAALGWVGEKLDPSPA